MSKEIEKLRIIDPKIKTTTIRHLRKEDSITLEDFVDDWIKSNPETDQDCCVEWMFLNKLYNNLVGLFIGNTLVSVAAIKETTYLDVPITYKEHAEIMFIGTKSEFQNFSLGSTSKKSLAHAKDFFLYLFFNNTHI